ncbi:hypothetical protein CTAYLR_008023 [Chrysophaeum taylorii]|uniref:Bystin n=1 Tax=Chrysophaeum taylorii TaxID=2483200 RepID=A0AAD7U722_9STRA|nr:hypothetical protein CTAYLR_008023 [Chrysophaeum taylorii]
MKKRVSLDAQLREDARVEVVARKRRKKKEPSSSSSSSLPAEEEEEEPGKKAQELARELMEDDEEGGLFGRQVVEEDEEEEGSDVEEEKAFEAVGLSAKESRVVDSYFEEPETRRTLADIILAKIAEKECPPEEDDEDGLPPKVLETYRAIGPILARYRSGKLPKALKVIPALERWDELLWLARPDAWSVQAVGAVTRIFASNLDPARAKVFYEDVLLPRCRDDLRTYRKLNYHLYQALHRALFKPAAWFKGILLPLARDATLGEAVIFASVLSKASVPAAHAAVVLLKLAEGTRTYSGATSVFLIALLNKKYALPVRVVSALVAYFARFVTPTTATVQQGDRLPVLWHQSLLVFAQRYRGDLQPHHLDTLKAVARHHVHDKITPDIRRELRAAMDDDDA